MAIEYSRFVQDGAMIEHVDWWHRLRLDRCGGVIAHGAVARYASRLVARTLDWCHGFVAPGRHVDWRAAHRVGGNVRVHVGLAFPSPHAAGTDPDGTRQSAGPGVSGVGNRHPRTPRRNRSDGATSASRSGLWVDCIARGDVSCQRPRCAEGPNGRWSPRDAAALAPAAAAVLDCRSLVGPVADASLGTTGEGDAGNYEIACAEISTTRT